MIFRQILFAAPCILLIVITMELISFRHCWLFPDIIYLFHINQ